MKKLAYLITHPIPYQASLMRELSNSKIFKLKVFYCSKITLSNYKDKEMNKKINWNYDLLSGYNYKFLKSFFDFGIPSFLLPINYGLIYDLKKNNYDYILIHGHARFYNLFVIIFSKILGIKVFLRSESNNQHAKKKLLSKFILSLINPFIYKYLAIGSLNRDYYLSKGINKKKIKMMYYTVDNNFFQDYKVDINQKKKFYNHHNLSNKTIFLFAAKYIERKNLIFLLTVFIDILNKNQDFKNKAHLLLIGDGELKPKVLKIIKDYNANISNLGFIDQKHIPFYYKISDIFIIPSKEENWGLTVNEAMCCGLPIIASDKVGSGYDLLDSNNSFKFRHDNQHELSQILLKSLNSDLKKMSRFSIKKISLFNNLLNMKVIEEIIT